MKERMVIVECSVTREDRVRLELAAGKRRVSLSAFIRMAATTAADAMLIDGVDMGKKRVKEVHTPTDPTGEIPVYFPIADPSGTRKPQEGHGVEYSWENGVWYPYVTG